MTDTVSIISVNDTSNVTEQEEIKEEDAQSDMPTQPSEVGSASTYTSISELDGVGPPTILQYIKESTKVKRTVPAPKPLSDR